MTGQLIEKDWEGNDSDIIYNWSGGTEENYENSVHILGTFLHSH
jgi:hypothetical protein